jgi:glycosyltransferase involved in cell wall biosynthesis
MKILHLLSQLPEATGSGIYLQAVMRQAARCGFENYLLAGVPAEYPELPKLQQLACRDASFVRFGQDLPFQIVGMSDVMPYASARFGDLSARELALYHDCFAEKLVAGVKRWQPDLIHAHHLWLLSSLARQAVPELPLLVSCHGSDLRQFHNCAHLQATVLAGCRKVDAVCALSAIQKSDIQRLYGIAADRIHLTGAGYDAERFFLPPAPGKGPVQVVYAGKLSRAKGVPWLLRALGQLAAEDFVFHLVGDSAGAEKQEILGLIGQLGSRIRVHGKLDQQRLASLLRQADLFVLPSLFEGVPLVLLEALASGCHIVTTALPGVLELLAGIDSSWIELVAMPRMASIDQPHAAEEEQFVASLRVAVQAQLAILQAGRGVRSGYPADLRQLLEGYTWEGVFPKIARLYQQLSGE